MIAKALLLPCQITFTAEIIQACLTDGNNLGVVGQRDQFLCRDLSVVLLIGMNADGGVDIVETLGNGNDIRNVTAVDGNAEETADAILLGQLQGIGKLTVERFQVKTIQVAMGVYKHTYPTKTKGTACRPFPG